LEGLDLDRMHTNRRVVGEALGNKWLVDFSTNRGWGDAPFVKKIEKLVDEVNRQSAMELSYEDLAFDPAAAQVWLRASDPDRNGQKIDSSVSNKRLKQEPHGSMSGSTRT
jgi:hypothetical protein